MPTPKPPRHKYKTPHRQYTLDTYLTGDLEGAHVVMGAMSAREMIRLRSGDMSEGDAIEFTASKVIEHNFDVDDIRDIDGEDFLVLGQAWNAAIKDKAVPPTPASS